MTSEALHDVCYQAIHLCLVCVLLLVAFGTATVAFCISRRSHTLRLRKVHVTVPFWAAVSTQADGCALAPLCMCFV